jgi:putative nucleotidyltransferase with HDIG domain
MAVRVISTRRTPDTERWLPHAFVATGFVVVLPAVLVSLLVPPTSLPMLFVSLATGIVLSLLAASLGEAIWKRLPSSQDLVFADLMLWGWLRRSVAERRLARAETLLGDDPHGASVEALTSLSGLLEARDARTYGHSQRVTRHAERIATTMGLPAAEVAKIRTAAALHDVGKLHTPRTILNKPGRLTDSEFALVKRHPIDGAAMASGIGDPEIVAMIRHHHERLDGRGYPDGLAGDAIPLGARIIAVADTFDAITSNRTYRRASHHKRALDVLATEAVKQLDGEAVSAFRGYYRGQRTVALSALVAAAPQRVLSWLGGASPAIGAGAASATSLLLGLGAGQPVVTSPDSAIGAPAPMVASAPKRASVVAAEASRRRPVAAGERRSATRERRGGERRERVRTRRPGVPHRGTTPGSNGGGGGDTPAAGGGQPSGGGGAANPRPTSPLPTPDGRPLVDLPGTRTPAVRVPEVKVPGVTVPEIKVPQVPGVPLPEIKTPETGLPEVKTPEITVPGVELPGLRLP